MKSPPPVIKLKKRLRKSTPKRRFTKKTVLKMLAASEASASTSTSSVPKSDSTLTIPTTEGGSRLAGTPNDGISPGTSPADLVQDFLNTGRTGRRNAMADILGRHAGTTTADLPSCLQALTTHDPATPSSSSSTQMSSPNEQPSTSATGASTSTS